MTPPQQIKAESHSAFEEVITRLDVSTTRRSRQQREVSRQLMELSTQQKEVITQQGSDHERYGNTTNGRGSGYDTNDSQRKEEMLRRTMGELETGAEILQRKAHDKSVGMFIHPCILPLFSLVCVGFCLSESDLQGKNDETPRGYLWIQFMVVLQIGTAFYIDIIIASIRYKVPIGGPGPPLCVWSGF